jgi:hypothetical protein
MNNIDEIFKNNTALLDEPEVKELIDYCQKQYAKVVEQYKKLDDLEFKITHECMHSEVILKNGKSSRETLESILKLLNDNA